MDARISLLGFLTIMSQSLFELPKVRLNDGNEMPALALGTFLGFENGMVKSKEKELSKIVCQAIDIGYRHFDTADIYETEDEVGEAVKMKIEEGVISRSEIFITTKLWNTNHERDQVVMSLKRQLGLMGLTYVDLYLMHWPIGLRKNNTFSDVDYLETWRGMEDTKTLGLARSIGLSNFNKEQLERVLEHGRIKPAALQIEVHLLNVEKEMVAFTQSHGIVVMGYSPLGSIVDRYGLKLPGPKADNPILMAIGNKYSKTVPQILLRWLVQRNVVPLPKTLNASRLKENINVFDFKLTLEEMEQISNFNSNTRYTLPSFWQDHPYYPFKKVDNPAPAPSNL